MKMLKLTFLAMFSVLMLCSLQAQHDEKQPFLGLYTRPVDAALASHLKLKTNQGYVVYKIFPHSPAAKAGLQRFDILLDINKQKLFSDIPLNKTVQMFKVGDKLKVSFLREGEVLTKDVTLSSKPKELCKHKTCPPQTPMFDDHIKSEIFKMMRDGKNADQMFKKLEQHMRHLQENKLQSNNSTYQQSSLKVSKKDKEHKITLQFDANGRHATVKDLNGKLIYSGRVDTENEKKLIAANILKKIDALTQQVEKHCKNNNIPYGK